jgi:hypothetical protein
MITIGIDPHKSSLTAVALQPSGEIAATIRLEVNSDTVDRLRRGPAGAAADDGGAWWTWRVRRADASWRRRVGPASPVAGAEQSRPVHDHIAGASWPCTSDEHEIRELDRVVAISRDRSYGAPMRSRVSAGARQSPQAGPRARSSRGYGGRP